LGEILLEAAHHVGTSFVEIYQNCVIFNPNEWIGLDDRRLRDENILYLKHGEPMIFGKDHDKGIRLNGFTPEVVQLGNGVSEENLLVHDETSMQLAFIISSMEFPQFPAPMGVIRRVQKQTYTEGLMAQIHTAQAKKGVGDLYELYTSADMWTVTEREEVRAKQTGALSSELDEAYVDEMEQLPEETTAVQDQLAAPIATLLPHAPVSIDAGASLAKAIRQMNAHHVGCLLVTDKDDRLMGIFTEKDVLMRVVGLVDDLTAVPVADYMTAHPIALTADLPIAQALHEMSMHGFRHVPLVDGDGRPEGVISFRDVVRHLKQNFN
jgi:CBS domain-containing protein